MQSTELNKINNKRCPSEITSIPVRREKKAIMGEVKLGRVLEGREKGT